MTKAEQAAAMRDEGKSIDEIAKHFGWTVADAYTRVWRGRNADLMRQRESARNGTAAAREVHRNWRRKNGIHAREITYIENADKLKARNKRILDAVRAGATYSEAAEPEGVSRNAVAGLCARAGLKVGHEPHRIERRGECAKAANQKRWERQKQFYDERRARIKDLLDYGHTQADVAEMYGLSKQTVSQMLHRHGIVAGKTPQAIAKRAKITSQAQIQAWSDPEHRSQRIASMKKAKASAE